MINVLALPLEEGIRRLKACGMQCRCKGLLPPRDSDELCLDPKVRKYIVRQQLLSDKEVELTFVIRSGKEV